MAYGAQATISGTQKLLITLARLKDSAARRVMRKAIAKAGSIVNKGAKKRAPKKRKLLTKSLGTKTKTYGEVVVAIVGPRPGHGIPNTKTNNPTTFDPIYYAHLVERGTVHSKAKAFLEPALTEQVSEINSAMRRVAWAAILKEIKK